MGFLRTYRWLVTASLAGGTGFRAASDRMMLLGFGSGFFWRVGNEQVRVLSSRAFTLTLRVGFAGASA